MISYIQDYLELGKCTGFTIKPVYLLRSLDEEDLSFQPIRKVKKYIP